jgi:hypothetical protein
MRPLVRTRVNWRLFDAGSLSCFLFVVGSEVFVSCREDLVHVELVMVDGIERTHKLRFT